jgi:hypothetical protein
LANTVITGPILDSFGQPVEGYLYGAQTARAAVDGALVTQTAVKGRVINGQPFLDDGVTPLEVPATALDTEAFEWIEDFRPYLKQTVRFTTIPVNGPVAYADLQDVKQPAESSTWIVPGWARELVDANAGMAGTIAYIDAVKTDIDATAAEVEGFAGTNNAQVAAMATTPGPLKNALDGSYVSVNEDGQLEQGGVVIPVESGENVDQLMADRFAALPAEDAATLTVITDADYVATPALGVAGGTLVKPARIGGGSTGDVDFDFDTHFRYSGGPGGKGIDGDFVGPVNDIAGVSLYLHPEFMTSRGISKIMLKVKAVGTELAYRVSVGDLWERDELHRQTVVSGSVYYVVVSLATARSRRIKFEVLSGSFGGVIIPAGEMISRAPDRPLCIVLADSFGGGASVPPNGASRLETFPNFIGQALGYDITNMSIGGTGWGITSTPFEQRVIPSLAMAPSVFMLIGSRNNGTDGDTAYTAARAALALTVDAPVVIVGGPAQSPFTVVNTAVKNAAVENGLKFADVLSVITGALTGSDGVHPTFAGHKALCAALLARMGVAQVRNTIAAIARTTPGVALVASPVGTAAVGANVTLTATVSPALPGRMEFRAGSTVLGQATVANGVATLMTGALGLGTYQLTARFLPADKFRVRAATSPSVGYTVIASALTDIITTNLLAELDVAQLSSLADGAAIASMTPTRGSKLDTLTQASGSLQMAYMTNDGDTKPAMKQIGVRALPAPVWASPVAANVPVTIFLAVKIVAPSATGNRYLTNYGSSGAGVRLNLSSAGALALTAQATAAVPNSPTLTGRWMILAIRFETGSQATIFQNRLTGDIMNVSHATTTYAGLGIGGGSGGTDGEIRHRAQYVYSGGMSDNDIQAMMVYLASRHGATLDS